MGGTEKVVTNLANLLSIDNNVKIISTYKLMDVPFFDICSDVQVEYLIENMIPNKETLKEAIKTIKVKVIFKEIIKSLKILILRKKLMVKAIKNLDCDIVISTRILHNRWVGKYANKEIIKIAQEHNHHNNNKKYIRNLIKSLKNFNYFMPVSQELADFYKPKLKNTKTIYIPNFIDGLPSERSNLQKKQLISVGRLDKIKGFEDLIDIFNIFQNTHSDWTLHIVGDGFEKEHLQNKINKLNLQDKVILCGTKLSKELEEEYINSSLYLMTSFSESFGLVLVEAASYGLPLLAFDSAQGAKEIIKNNQNGFLIPDRNKTDFVNKINELLENSQKQKQFSDSAIAIANKFSKNNIAVMWKKFISDIEEKNV